MTFRDPRINAYCDPPELACECGGNLKKSALAGNHWVCLLCGAVKCDVLNNNSAVEPDGTAD